MSAKTGATGTDAAGEARASAALDALGAEPVGPGGQATVEDRALGYVMAQLGYDASERSPLRGNYHRAVGSGDHEMAREREDLVTFSRVLRQKSGLYKGFARTAERRVVGAAGLWPEPIEANESSERACALFREWGSSALCDAQRRRALPALQRAAVHEIVVGGDTLANRVVRSAGSGLGVGDDPVRQALRLACVQLVESERIASPTPGSITAQMRNGVEVDDLGAPIAYHVVDYGETGSSLVYGRTLRVPAERASLVGFDFERVSQTRGTPLLLQGLGRLADVEETHEAITTAIKLTAVFVLVLKTASPANADKMLSRSIARSNAGVNGTGASGGASGGANVRNVAGMRAGQILSAGENDSLDTVKHENPPAQFDVWNRVTQAVIASGAGIPREVALGDFASLNFSQARMVNMYAEETFSVLRDDVVAGFCAPLFRWIAARGVLAGAIPPDPSTADGIPLAGSWTRPPEVEYDRKTGIEAAAMAVENNFSTHAIEARKRGLDPAAVIEQRGRERAAMAERDILPPSTPGAKVTGKEETGGE